MNFGGGEQTQSVNILTNFAYYYQKILKSLKIMIPRSSFNRINEFFLPNKTTGREFVAQNATRKNSGTLHENGRQFGMIFETGNGIGQFHTESFDLICNPKKLPRNKPRRRKITNPQAYCSVQGCNNSASFHINLNESTTKKHPWLKKGYGRVSL